MMNLFTKKIRVKFRTGWADVALDAYANAGDTLALGEPVARALIEAGTADATADPIGRAVTPLLTRTCPACTATIGEYDLACGVCRLRLS